MKLIHITFFLLILCFPLFAQKQANSYRFRIYLKDKGATEFLLSQPETFLTPKAIERKERQSIPIDSLDLPVSPEYFQSISRSGGKIVAFSKWFKTITAELQDSLQIDEILKLPFVESVKYVWRGSEKAWNYSRQRLALQEYPENRTPENPWGITEKQFDLHNAKNLLTNGYSGKGIAIGIIDGGFKNADVMPLFENVKICGAKNFVPNGDLYSSTNHGTKVLSTIAVNMPYVMMGSAPEADFYLFRSEDETSEFPVEEDYWVRAVEYADSLGLDLINTSLGYADFDDKNLSYTTNDLDGKTSFMSHASDKAFEKGLFLITSAGNEGNKNWGKITAPADAFDVLTVGAVDCNGMIARFSSKGYTADNRVKPDVVSVGKGTAVISSKGTFEFSNGTSFASPFMAGLVASLWSINPSLDRYEIIDIVRKSSDRYNSPDSIYGYGIPDFGKAMQMTLQTIPVSGNTVTEKDFSVSKPDDKTFLFTLNNSQSDTKKWQVNLLDESGNLLQSATFETESVQLALPDKKRLENEFVHFVFKSPTVQKTLRFKL